MKKIEQRLSEIKNKQDQRRHALNSNAMLFFRGDGESIQLDGGAGSGNWGHAGVPGSVGGSSPGGGVQHRLTTKSGKFTSYAKQRKAMATPHKASVDELKAVPVGTKLTMQKYRDGAPHGSAVYLTKTGENEYKTGNGTSYTSERLNEISEKHGHLSRIAVPKNSAKSAEDNRRVTSEELRGRMDSTKPMQSKQEAYDKYVGETSKVWKTFDDATKQALVSYTGGGYDSINSSLRNGTEHWDPGKIDRITKAIDKVELQEDSWLQRGTSIHAVQNLFNHTGEITPDNVIQLIGATGTDKAFTSCGSSFGTGFTYKDVELQIFAPKGTKAIYAEPFSQHGGGDAHENWNGTDDVSFIGSENETILQRGTTFQCTNAKFENDKFCLEVAVINQNPV